MRTVNLKKKTEKEQIVIIDFFLAKLNCTSYNHPQEAVTNGQIEQLFKKGEETWRTKVTNLAETEVKIRYFKLQMQEVNRIFIERQIIFYSE